MRISSLHVSIVITALLLAIAGLGTLRRNVFKEEITFVSMAGTETKTSLILLVTKASLIVFDPDCSNCKRFIRSMSKLNPRHDPPQIWISLGSFAETKKVLGPLKRDISWYVVSSGMSVFQRIPNPLPYMIDVSSSGSRVSVHSITSYNSYAP